VRIELADMGPARSCGGAGGRAGCWLAPGRGAVRQRFLNWRVGCKPSAAVIRSTTHALCWANGERWPPLAWRCLTGTMMLRPHRRWPGLCGGGATSLATPPDRLPLHPRHLYPMPRDQSSAGPQLKSDGQGAGHQARVRLGLVRSLLQSEHKALAKLGPVMGLIENCCSQEDSGEVLRWPNSTGSTPPT